MDYPEEMVRKGVISPKELKDKFKHFVADRCGLYFKDHDLKSLEDAIIERAKAGKFNSIPEYYAYITTSEDRENEFRELLNLLTINHTYFFRNESHFKALKENILPEIAERKRKEIVFARKFGSGNDKRPSLRIWSAGCSTGEEPYTIAMVVRDVIEDFDKWDIEIYATDASTYVLDRARKAFYTENSMKLLSQEHKDKYFSEIGEKRGRKQYALGDTIKRMVHFDYLNLIRDNFPQKFDIIFCRNVVIYFELETIIKVMNRFHSSLTDNGSLFIGYSETLQFISDKFRMQDWENAIFYRKAKKIQAPRIEVSAASAEAPEKIEVEKIIEEMAKAELLAEEKAAAERKAAPSKKIRGLLVEITKALHLKQYDRALSLVREAELIDKNAIKPHYLAAEIHANQGRFNEAKEQLKITLGLNSLFVPAHYLFGFIYMEEEDPEQAKASLKKALYLDRNFALAYYNLANIYKKEGNREDATRAYRNTLKVLSRCSPDDIIPYSGGLNVAILLGVCKNSIERLKIEE